MKLTVFVLVLMVVLPFAVHAGVIRSGSLTGLDLIAPAEHAAATVEAARAGRAGAAVAHAHLHAVTAIFAEPA